LSYLSGGAGNLGSISVAKHVAGITDDDIPWWRVVKTRALTKPVRGFLQPRRSKEQAERLVGEGVDLMQPLKPRQEVRRYADVQDDKPFHPLSHLVQTHSLHSIGRHKRTLFWLHGPDGTALRYSYLPLWHEQRVRGTKIVLPSAPLQKDIVNRLRFCWFRCGSDDPGLGEVDEAAADVVDLIDSEGSEIGPENVYVGGYSQGAMLAVHLGVTLGAAKLAGVIALNGCKLPCTRSSATSAARMLQMLKFNGDADGSVDPSLARASFGDLSGIAVADIDYPSKGVTHAVKVLEEKQLISKALTKFHELTVAERVR